MNQAIYKRAIILLVLIFSIGKISAQTDSTKKSKNAGKSIEISNMGIQLFDPSKAMKNKKHKNFHLKMHFDFGFNNVIDNTNYDEVPANYYYDGSLTNPVGAPLKESHMELNTGKSINFNFWPLWFSQDVAKHNVQIESGIGFQFFNYRFSSKVKHSDAFLYNDPLGLPTNLARFERITDPAELDGKAKNKLGISYISVPLMLRFNKLKKKGKAGFTIAGGVIGSYKLKSWTKFYGEKNGGNYDIKDFMTQLSVEIGVPGIIKFYGTYALQPMYDNQYIDRTPFAIGIRL